jgi:cbb3-type cytochrome oxidase subunit 3
MTSRGEFTPQLRYRADMETYFTFWTVVMFTFNVMVVIFGFGLIHRELREQAVHQDAIWQRLFTKADNTERLTQEILTRLANEQLPH